MPVLAEPALALRGTELAAAFRAGIHRLISREELINKINVFPVPDGDTGTNLAHDTAGRARGVREPARMRTPARR